jgi:hypothetical protein
MPTVRRNEPTPENPEFLERLAQEFVEAKAFAEKATARADALKKQLSEYVDSHGDPDENGSLWVTVAPGLELKRERRSGRHLQIALAETWAKDHGVWESVREVVEQVSEDNLTTLAWERPELSEDIGNLYGEKVTWAFRVVQKKVNNENEDA